MNSVPPKIDRANTKLAIIIVAATATGIAATVFFFNPALHQFYPPCQFHRLTGLNCPGCGGTRAVYALLHGQFSTALRDNALVVGGGVVLGLRGGWLALKRIRGFKTGEFLPARLLWPLLVIVVGFTVLRNLPAFAFLSP